jgi:IPT/TIG domain
MATEQSGSTSSQPTIVTSDPADGSNEPIKAYLASLLGIYLIGMSILSSYMLYNLWPPQQRRPSANQPSAQAQSNRRSSRTDTAATNSNSNTNSSAASNTNTAATTNSSAATNNNQAARSSTTNSNTNTAGTAAVGGTDTSSNVPNGAPEQNDTNTAAEEILPTVTLFRGWLVLTHSVEVRLLLIALLAGALGSYIHAATSFADYVGNRKLSGNWVWWYLLRPFIGMSLALVFYFVVRGGFISPSAGGTDMNPFGIAAMAALVGLFSKNAIDKLNEVFTSLFGSKGDDKRGDKLQSPTISAIKPNKGPLAGQTAVTITGSGILPKARVTIGGKAASGVVISSDGKTIAAITPQGDAAGSVDVEVVNENAQKGTLPNGFTYE